MSNLLSRAIPCAMRRCLSARGDACEPLGLLPTAQSDPSHTPQPPARPRRPCVMLESCSRCMAIAVVVSSASKSQQPRALDNQARGAGGLARVGREWDGWRVCHYCYDWVCFDKRSSARKVGEGEACVCPSALYVHDTSWQYIRGRGRYHRELQSWPLNAAMAFYSSVTTNATLNP